MNINDCIDYDNTIYLTTLIFSSLFFVLFLIYFIPIIIYLKQNYNTNKLNLFWINYVIINTLLILFLLLYILKLIINKKEREENPYLLSNNFFPIIINICLVMLVYSVINNLIFDLISAFKATHKLKLLSQIKTKEANFLYRMLKEINLQNIFDEKAYSLYFIVINIVHVGLLVLYILAYIDTDIKRTFDLFSIQTFNNYLLKDYYYLVLVGLIAYMFLLRRNRNILTNCNYYNEDLFEQKLFNAYYNRAIYFVNILYYQFMIELIINMPIFLFITLKLFNVISFIILFVFVFLYIFLGGNLYLNIDENNNAMQCPNSVKKLFCFTSNKINLGHKTINEIFNDFIFRYDANEQAKLTDIEMNLYKKNLIVKNKNPKDKMYPLQTADDKIYNSSKKLFNFIPNLINRNINLNVRNNSDFPRQNVKTVIDFTSLCDYYILYKLLYLFFNENHDIYDSQLRKMNDDTYAFKRVLSDSNPFRRKSSLGINASVSNNINYGINKQDFINSIERISRISIIDSKKLKTSIKASSDDIFISLEEKELFEEFKSKYGNNQDTEYRIESMFSESFFEVAPFLQLKIDDILKALLPSYNKKLFNIFIKKISPYRNKIEQNLFMTHDSLLIIEVYEKKDFISSEQLKKFVYQYRSYLQNTVKNMNYTFLPLLLGVFNIQISGLNKIAIMYRNPLHFTLYNNFNNWITFYINESTEKLKASLILDDVIDLNEIEVRNALKINDADYDEVKKNFQQDLTFLKNINLNIYPVVRLFIGDENGAIKAMDSNNLGYNKNYKITNMNEPSILDESTQKQQNISELLEMSDFGNLNLSKKISSDFMENELNSILEREYYSMSGNDTHTIKIYFTNVFRTGNELSRKKREFLNDAKDDISLSYRKFIEDELFNYLTKASSFLEENDKKEKENNDLDIILKKKMNLIEQQNLEEEKKSSDSSDSEEFIKKNSEKKENNENKIINIDNDKNNKDNDKKNIKEDNKKEEEIIIDKNKDNPINENHNLDEENK